LIFSPCGKRGPYETKCNTGNTADGKWRAGWYFVDELGLMLQLDALHMSLHVSSPVPLA
jgi:hypothetical protein